MTLLSSIRPGTRAPLHQGSASASPSTGSAEAEVPLPRHLLVALAGIAADLTSLRQRRGDDPQLQEPLDRILGKLDGLVDSIYERAADSGARPVEASGEHGAVITADRPLAGAGVRAARAMDGAASTHVLSG